MEKVILFEDLLAKQPHILLSVQPNNYLLRRPAVLERIHTLVSFVQLLPESYK